MDHPAVLNAVNLRMHEQLAEIRGDFAQDEDIGVGVLTGSGHPSFSVGQDLRSRPSATAPKFAKAARAVC